jgi:glycosyltransferase involved in cell wall biosynthesis
MALNPKVRNIPESASGLSAAVVICTRNRPHDIEESCELALQHGEGRPLVVVDASSDRETKKVIAYLGDQHRDVVLHYVPARIPGLARQRNQAAEFCKELGVDIIHFIDDDTSVLPGYFSTIEARFAQDPHIAGISGLAETPRTMPIASLKRLFLLWAPHRGTVLRSGRSVSCDGCSSLDSGDLSPQWLMGCAMSYRTDVVLEHRFDDRLEGYSLGEDTDFGFRVSRTRKLAVERSARYVHRVSLGDLAREKYAYLHVVVLYCWVREHRDDGMSVAAFWWCTLGDFLLHATDGLIASHRGGMDYAKGILRGVLTVAKGRATRSAVG